MSRTIQSKQMVKDFSPRHNNPMMSRTMQNTRQHYDQQDLPHVDEVPYIDDPSFDDVPLNQSIRFGTTRGDYDQMNQTMNTTTHVRRSNNQEFVQQYRTN